MANQAGGQQSGSIVGGNYVPVFPPERGFYEAMWKYVNPTGAETLSGPEAVAFFQKSEVDNGFLRQIWSLSTVANVMKKENFFTALRYITMVQNGEFPLTKEKLESSASLQFPPPKFTGVQLPTTPPPVAPLPPPQAYAMTPEEQTKYAELFKTYDTARAGVLPQSILMPIFLKSGIPPQVVNNIWVISDVDKDTMLSSIEFSVAFHLIVCISKKQLPMPPGLPLPLLALCQQQQQARSASVSTPHIPHSQTQTHARPIDETSPHKSKPETHSHSHNIPGDRDHQSETSHVKTTHSSESSGSFKYLLQRVATEKISLSASVTNSEADIETIKERLTTSLTEINGLESEIEELRNRLIEAYGHRGAIQFDEARAKAEKDRLSLVVTEGRRELARLAGDQIEPSPLLAQIGDRIAISSVEGLRHANSGSGEVSRLNADLETLRLTLTNLTTEKSRVGEESNRLRNSLASAQSSLNSLQNSSKENELEALKAENILLRNNLESVLQNLATQLSLTVTTPVHVPSPIYVAEPIPATSIPVKASSTETSGFDVPIDSGFGGFGDNTGFENSNFSFEQPSQIHTSSFETFGETTHVNDFESDGFNAFGSVPQPTSGDGFASFESDGFSNFGSSLSTSTPAPPPTSQPSTSASFAGFDAFGPPSSSVPPPVSQSDDKMNAFDAFNW